MTSDQSSKVTARHLKRNAYLYIRQSTVRQVFENSESTKRQYDLRQRAIALGWKQDQIIVIDTDLGQSGASAVDREGFKKLVAEVGVGHAGIVLGLEVSRLARNCADWYRLLEICALTDTLILDEDGIYDPAHFNDRLLLGLKGTMSEAELHVLYARLRGGLLNKARRGDLQSHLPVGLCYDERGQVILDPDKQVQASIRLLFDTFLRTGTGYATVKYFREQKLLFPRRPDSGPHRGELIWGPLGLWRAVSALHNPRYAGAFVFGRTRSRKQPDGHTKRERIPRDEWHTLIPDAHPGYVTWAEYEEIQQRLKETALAYGAERHHCPPREGPALLQGLVVCGRCGRRMYPRYHIRKTALVPDYWCKAGRADYADGLCQVIPGASIDAAISQMLVDAVSPLAVGAAFTVHEEIVRRLDDADRLRRQHVERAQYDADLARNRYMKVDPANRLVADSLEADWNDKLATLTEASEQYGRARQTDQSMLNEAQRQRIAKLPTEFATIFNDPGTAARDRKRMVALLIEDVTLIKQDDITAHVRFKGGKTTTLHLPIPGNAWQIRATHPDVLVQIDTLLEDHTNSQVATILNERGLKTGAGEPFTQESLSWIRYHHRLRTLKQRLRAKGWLTIREVCAKLGVGRDQLRAWRKQGRLPARICSDRAECLYHPALVEAGHKEAAPDHPVTKPAGGVV